MIKSTPNVWYNIDELYTITSNGKIELNVKMPNGKEINDNQEEIIDLQVPPSKTESQVISECDTKIDDGNILLRKQNFLLNFLYPGRLKGRVKRWTWICILVIIFICCIYSGWNVFNIIWSLFWRYHPQQIIDYMPVSQIPFPAITICNENKVIKSNVDDDDDLSWFKEWELRQALCDLEIYGNPPDAVAEDDYIINKALLKFSPSLVNFMHTCEFGDENCFKDFTPVFTDDGLCYTFNGISNSVLYHPDVFAVMNATNVGKQYNYYGWTPGTGYVRSVSGNGTELAYPKYVASNKHEFNLQLMVKEDSEEISDDSCRGSSGFKILIHDPATIPLTSTAKIISVPSDRTTNIILTPTLTTVSNDVTLEYPEIYPCRNWNEHKLDYFNFYTKENCIFECFVKYTIDSCNCSAFYMPRKNGTKVCSSEQKSCLDSAHGNFFYNSEIFDGCSCLPSCQQVSYDVSVSNNYYSWTKYQKIHTYKSMSRVRIHYSDFHLTWRKFILDTRPIFSTFVFVNIIVLVALILLVTFFGTSVICLVEFLIQMPSLSKKSKNTKDDEQNNSDVCCNGNQNSKL